MDERNTITENKKVNRRKSDFVLGRRKSGRRSSCVTVKGLDSPKQVESVSPDQQLKQKILDSVKFAAHKVSEELTKKGDKHSLHVLVTVEESCENIEQRLESSGILKKALQLNIDKENNKEAGTQAMNMDQQYWQDSAYLNSLQDESKAWDVELQKERKALSASEKALERASQTVQVPYMLDGVTDVSAAINDIAVSKREVSNTVLSLSHVVHLYDQCLSSSVCQLQAHDQKIRNDFEECIQGENIVDIVNGLIHANYK